VVEQEQVVEE